MSDFHLVAYLVLRREDQILLARRHGVTYADGLWSVPGGHVEPGETLAQTCAREAFEEIGVRIDPADLQPIGVCRYVDDGIEGLDVFFTTSVYAGEPAPVTECDRVAWHRVDDLPAPTVPWLPDALERHVIRGVWFAEVLG